MNIDVTKGKLIIFEGIDGTGKGTLVEMTDQALQAAGVDHLVVKFPGQTALGKRIREIAFIDPATNTKTMAPEVFNALMLADCIQTIETVLLPALKRGAIVVCDRSPYSQMAYTATRSMNDSIRNAFEHLVIRKVNPDCMFLLLGTASHLLDRANKRTTENHQQGKAWNKVEDQRQIQNAYLKLLAPYPVTEFIDTDISTPAEIFEKELWPVVNRIISDIRS